jgi:hypothetical protein
VGVELQVQRQRALTSLTIGNIAIDYRSTARNRSTTIDPDKAPQGSVMKEKQGRWVMVREDTTIKIEESAPRLEFR